MSEKVVLLVEDDEDSRVIYGGILKHNGYQVLEAVDGAMAVTVLTHVRPHLVLLDISLPHVDGWTVAKWIKKELGDSAVPFVAITAFSRLEHRARADEIGFADYLTKPVDPVDLLKCVEREIGRSLQEELADSVLGIEPPPIVGDAAVEPLY